MGWREQGQLVGDEIRNITGQTDVTDTLCKSLQLIATALAFSLETLEQKRLIIM